MRENLRDGAIFFGRRPSDMVRGVCKPNFASRPFVPDSGTIQQINMDGWPATETDTGRAVMKTPATKAKALFKVIRALASQKSTLISIPAGAPFKYSIQKWLIDFSYNFSMGRIFYEWKNKKGRHGYLGNFKISSGRSRVENWNNKIITSFRRKPEYQSVTRQLCRLPVFFI